MTKRIPPRLRFNKHRVDGIILKQARKEGNIVFGAQAIKRKLGINARKTFDYDLFSKMPKSSADKTERSLDKVSRKDSFFVKKGQNKGTWKVKHHGVDMRKNTDDDVGIADYTKTPRPAPKTFTFRGVKFRNLREEAKAKIKVLKDKRFAFRHEKDAQDLKRILRFGRGNL